MICRLKFKKKGFVFVTVVMMIVIMALITLSVISLNSSQSINAEKEIKRLQAESLGIGATQAMLLDANITSQVNFNQTMDGTDFTVTTGVTNNDSGPFGTDPLQVQVQY